MKKQLISALSLALLLSSSHVLEAGKSGSKRKKSDPAEALRRGLHYQSFKTTLDGISAYHRQIDMQKINVVDAQSTIRTKVLSDIRNYHNIVNLAALRRLDEKCEAKSVFAASESMRIDLVEKLKNVSGNIRALSIFIAQRSLAEADEEPIDLFPNPEPEESITHVTGTELSASSSSSACGGDGYASPVSATPTPTAPSLLWRMLGYK
jgi:hypothetical protein